MRTPLTLKRLDRLITIRCVSCREHGAPYRVGRYYLSSLISRFGVDAEMRDVLDGLLSESECPHKDAPLHRCTICVEDFGAHR